MRDHKAWLELDWPEGSGSARNVTALHIAAKTGLLSYTETRLRSKDVDVNQIDGVGRTALWWAADKGHAAIVRLLVQAGADPDKAETTAGLKPLHQAASQNHHEAVAALLEAGVDPLTRKTKEHPGRWCGNAPRSTGHTPLMVRLSRRPCSRHSSPSPSPPSTRDPNLVSESLFHVM
jgi:ankyrin repeat protein